MPIDDCIQADVITSEQIEAPLLSGEYHLLILEDDPVVADALETLIYSWGFKVQTANNCVMALASLKVSTPDIILSDYQLQQGETGLDVIAEINRKTHKMIPALLLMGNTNKENIKILQTQPYPILYKPVQPEILKVKLIALL